MKEERRRRIVHGLGLVEPNRILRPVDRESTKRKEKRDELSENE